LTLPPLAARALQHLISTIQFRRNEIATAKSNVQQISTEALEEERQWHLDLERRRSQVVSELTASKREITDRQRRQEDQNWQFEERRRLAEEKYEVTRCNSKSRPISLKLKARTSPSNFLFLKAKKWFSTKPTIALETS
jgi:hypothetical protein